MRELLQLLKRLSEALGDPRQLPPQLAELAGRGRLGDALSASDTSRCWIPSCRSRSIRRLVSSAALTIRALEAASSSRACVLAMTVAASSVKSAIWASVPAGSGSGRLELTTVAPHSRTSTLTGQATDDRMPS
jgi:hypothetical protein